MTAAENSRPPLIHSTSGGTDSSSTHLVAEVSSERRNMMSTEKYADNGMPISRVSKRRRVIFGVLVAIGLGLSVWAAVVVMTGQGKTTWESMEGIRLPVERIREPAVSGVHQGNKAGGPDTRVFEVKVREVDTGKGQASAREVVVVERPATPEPKGSIERYSVNVASCKKRTHAESLAETLRKRGYTPAVIEVTLPGKGVWYRVSLGRFASEEEAWSLARAFQDREGKECFVTAAE